MQSQPFSDIVDACLDRLRAGVSIDDCVAPYPEHADELRAQLQTAQSILASRPQIQPEPSAQAQGRARLLGALAQMREEPEPALGLVGPMRALFLGIGSRLSLLPQALPAVLAMLVLGGAAWGVSAAAGNPNPGDWFGGSSSQEARVELRGTITAIAPPMLTISTDTGEVSVQIDDGTEFEDDNETSLALADFSVGDFVKISAFRDEAGALIAREVELEEGGDEATDENEDGDRDGDRDGDGDDDAGPSGPGSPNSGPGNAEDPDEDDDAADADNSGPGNSDDPHEDEADDDDDDRSGPSDNSGPGSSSHDDDEEPEDEKDNSGPGSSDDDEHDDEHDEEDDEDPDDD